MDFIYYSARIGCLALDIGEARIEDMPIDEQFRARATKILVLAVESGGVLESMARIVLACLTDEILIAKYVNY